MNNKPIRTLQMSVKKNDGYLKLGSNATWDNDKWNWSINVNALRELITLIDSGVIEEKKGYIGGKCAVFENKNKPEGNHELPMKNVKDDDIPF